MIIAIETSATVCAVGFYSDGTAIVEYKSNTPLKHSELVGSFVEKGLQITEDNIQLVSVAIGPGSFTGLRIGLSYAQGFCFGRNIPIVGVSNHQVLAKQASENKDIYTIINAHRQELYVAKHKANADMDMDFHKIIKLDKIADELPGNCQIVFLKGTLPEAKIESLTKKNINCKAAEYKTSILSEIGYRKFLNKGGQNPEDLQPMYIRPFAGIQ